MSAAEAVIAGGAPEVLAPAVVFALAAFAGPVFELGFAALISAPVIRIGCVSEQPITSASSSPIPAIRRT
jgi:hypothetical protein